MSPRKVPQKNVEKDAEAVEGKFGDFADVYAETRREAAETAGNDPGKDHWDEVADTVEGDEDR